MAVPNSRSGSTREPRKSAKTGNRRDAPRGPRGTRGVPLAAALLPARISIAAFGEPTTLPWMDHGPLRVSDSARTLVHQDGTPFHWLGDTAWALHQNLSREDVEIYLVVASERGAHRTTRLKQRIAPTEESP